MSITNLKKKYHKNLTYHKDLNCTCTLISTDTYVIRTGHIHSPRGLKNVCSSVKSPLKIVMDGWMDGWID